MKTTSKSEKVNFWSKIFISWIPIAIASTIILGTTYVLSQQVYRMSANDPQIQVSEDIADKLSQGTPLKNVIPQVNVDISKSLSQYVILFDDAGNLIATNANINGNAPFFPKGVLDFAKSHGQDKVTWQPEPGVRQATVITYYNGATSGFVLVGRSLRDVEIRENNLLSLTVISWIVILFTTLTATTLLKFFLFKKFKKN